MKTKYFALEFRIEYIQEVINKYNYNILIVILYIHYIIITYSTNINILVNKNTVPVN